MAKSGVIDRDLGWEEIKEELEKLKSMAVKVGICEGDGDVSGKKRVVAKTKTGKVRHDKDGNVKYKKETVTHASADVAQYAYWNEVGTSEKKNKKIIPSRPFIRSWVDNNQKQIEMFMSSAFRHVASGQWTAEEAMKRIGEFGVSGIKRNIREGQFEPNNPKTAKRKGSSQPLIDTGTLRNAINYAVVKSGRTIARGERKDGK